MGILDLFSGIFKKNKYSGIKRKCPNCGKMLDLGWERCKSCGVHIDSMFVKKCPNCGKPNNLKAEKCKHCGNEFEGVRRRFSKKYVCPICGYKATYYMMRCPACNTRLG